MTSECASSEQKIKISQFEVTETPYKKTVDGKEVDKISKKNPKKTEYTMIYLSKCLFKTCFHEKLYITHKFEVYNDAFHWPK